MKKTQPGIQFILCIDWETSGATWGGDSTLNYQGLAFGAIVANAETFEPIEKLYREIQYDSSLYKWSQEAEAIHGMSQEYLKKNGVSREDAAADLATLILKYWGPKTKVMMLGHNTEFDRKFTNQLLKSIEIEFSVNKETHFDSWIEVHHVMLDTSSTGFITLGLYKSDLLFEKIGFEDRQEHNALVDAEQTLATCSAIRQIVNSVIN